MTETTFSSLIYASTPDIQNLQIGGLTLPDRHILEFYYAKINDITIYSSKHTNFSPSRKLENAQINITSEPNLTTTHGLIVSACEMTYNKKILNLLLDKLDIQKISTVTGKETDGSKGSLKSSGDKLPNNELFTGLMYVPPAKVDDLKAFIKTNSPLSEFISRNSDIHYIQNDNLFFRKIKDKKDAIIAEKLLFHSLRKPQDGIIARTVNRNFSLPVSRILSRFSFTPNQLSVANGIFAVISVFFLVFGHELLGLSFYLSGALGGIFMQMCSIYDGCDGEIARVKFQYTHFGDWLDTIMDDITNSMYFIGIFIWSYLYTKNNIYIYMGIAAFTGQWIANFVMYYYLIKVAGTGNNQDYKVGEEGGFLAAVTDKLKYLTKRDFHLFAFMVFGLFGKYHIAAYFIFTVAVITGTILLFQHIKLMLTLKKQSSN